MSSEAKRVKILTLVELFLGLALIGLGVWVLFGGMREAGIIACGEGVLTLFLGARGALVSNVPARIGKLVPMFLLALLAQAACAAALVYLIGPQNVSADPAPVCACAVPALPSAAVCLKARGMAKRAER